MNEANLNAANAADVRFFLGANTPVGFVGYLDDLYLSLIHISVCNTA